MRCKEEKSKKLIICDVNFEKDYFNFYKVFNKKNVIYINCTFEKIILDGGLFDNITFEKCRFKDCFFKNIISKMADVHFVGGSFKGCSFIFCSLPGIEIKDSLLKNTEFKNTSLKGGSLIGNCYINVKFIDDCNLMNTLILNTHRSMDINFINEKSYTKLNYGTYIDRFQKIEDKKEDGRRKNFTQEEQLKTSYSFMDFAEQYRINHVSGKYGVCFYESKKAFHKTLTGKSRLKSALANFVCGYGEKPIKTFLLSLGVILLFTIIYAITGINTSKELNTKVVGGRNILETLIYCLYFSVVTFSTVGYGDITPTGIIGAILSVIEIILGILLIGIWTATLVRKMTR